MNQMKQESKLMNNEGFTLVELMISVAISLTVIGGIYMTYQSQQKSYVIQEQAAAIQQNLRAGMYIMQDELRMAGYDPDSIPATPTVTAASNNTVTFERDNGTSTLTKDTCTYSYNGANRTLDRDLNGSGAQPIAEDIQALGFAYAFDRTGDGDNQLDTSPNGHLIWAIDSDGDGLLDAAIDTDDDGDIDVNDNAAGVPVTGAYYGFGANVLLSDIRAVKIWVLARGNREDQEFFDRMTYVVGNQRITPNNSFRHQMLTTTVRCRNMEILTNG
jgi:type IV pilus assembly protein PilW